MKLLTSDSFEKARTFVMEQGREGDPAERCGHRVGTP